MECSKEKQKPNITGAFSMVSSRRWGVFSNDKIYLCRFSEVKVKRCRTCNINSDGLAGATRGTPQAHMWTEHQFFKSFPILLP